MEAFKILIVEDDMLIAADISSQLTREGYEVTGILPRGESAIEHVATDRPNMALMDIVLKGKMDGCETARILFEQFQLPIVFLTSNVDDATFDRAKASKPYAFVAKPFKKRELFRAIDLVRTRLIKASNALSPAKESLEEEDSIFLHDRIFVRHKDRRIKIYTQDILYLEADRSYSKIRTKERDYILSQSLKTVESKLNSDSFVRIHRSYLINLIKVDSLSDQVDFVSIGEFSLPVSRSYREGLANSLKLI